MLLTDLTPLDFAGIDDYTFNPKTGRFRVATGAGKGQFISREAVLNQNKKYLEVEREALVKLGDRLTSGELSLREFQKQAGESVRRIQVASAVLGRGGRDKMTQKDWATVQEQIKIQLYKGRDKKTGKRFGLKFLAQEIAEGKVSPAQLRYRLGLYAQSGSVVANAMDVRSLKESGMTHGVRVLAAGHVHCKECLEYAALPPQPIDKVVAIATRCSCRNQCKCSILGMTLEEAIGWGK